MHFETIRVKQVAGAIGAEIHGIDLTRDLDDQTIAEIAQEQREHLVVFFRDQDITPARHLALVTREDRLKTAARLDRDAVLSAVHPVVRTHPETGKKILYVNIGHTAHFEGMTETESAPLLNCLHIHQTQPEFTCRSTWRPGSIAF